MYCSSCGSAVAYALSYCNYCGAKLNRDDKKSKAPEVKPELLISSMVAVFIFGLISITVLMGVMKTVLDLPVDRVLAISVLPFLLMLGLEGVLLRLLFRGKQRADRTDTKTLSTQHSTNELDAVQARVLSEGVPSVTEHTTRAFDPVYTERK